MDRPLTGRDVLLSLLAFFGVMIAVNVGFIVAATRSFPGEVGENPYLDGVKFNRSLEERARQEALGWSVAIDRRQPGVLRIVVIDRFGAPLTGLTVAGVFARPATDREDRTVRFAPHSGGYEASIADAPSGVWRLRASADDGAEGRLDFETRVIIP